MASPIVYRIHAETQQADPFQIDNATPRCSFGNPESFKVMNHDFKAFFAGLPGAEWQQPDGTPRKQYWDTNAYASVYTLRNTAGPKGSLV